MSASGVWAMRVSRSVAAEQQVDLRLPQRQAALLRGDEAVLHRVGHAHADVEADDARRALERVRRAHARLELIGRAWIALERQQAGGQHLRLASRLPRGTDRASRAGSRSSALMPRLRLQRVEQQLVVEQADRVAVPRSSAVE